MSYLATVSERRTFLMDQSCSNVVLNSSKVWTPFSQSYQTLISYPLCLLKLLFDSNIQSYEQGKQWMGQRWTPVWLSSNERLIAHKHRQTHVQSDKSRGGGGWMGGHAELMVED